MVASASAAFVGSKANGPTSVDGKSFPRNHEGYSGYSINQIANVVPSPALNGDPNIILLMIGTNDSWVEENNNGPRNDYARQWADSYVAVIPGVVQQRINQGFNVILVDQYKGFPSNGLGSDNLHPNDTGYRFVGQTWCNAIKDYLR